MVFYQFLLLPHKKVSCVEVQIEWATLGDTVGDKVIEHHICQVESLPESSPTHAQNRVTVLTVHKVAFYHRLVEMGGVRNSREVGFRG